MGAVDRAAGHVALSTSREVQLNVSDTSRPGERAQGWRGGGGAWDVAKGRSDMEEAELRETYTAWAIGIRPWPCK